MNAVPTAGEQNQGQRKMSRFLTCLILNRECGVSSGRRFFLVLMWTPSLIWATHFGSLLLSANFHAVVPNEVYRSSQLNADDLTTYVAQYHIQSILNLRGPSEGSEWYQDETRISEDFHIQQYDVGISSIRDVPDEKIQEIVTVLREAPKPLLIHCKSGADRTGLASALYLYVVRHIPAQEAIKQLSVRYGHLRLMWNSSTAMDRTFWRYAAAHP